MPTSGRPFRSTYIESFRSLVQHILQEIAAGYGYPRPNLGEILYHEAKQPSPSRLTLLEEVNAELCRDFPSQLNTNAAAMFDGDERARKLLAPAESHTSQPAVSNA
jgi:hypothetical protein